jgi:hypothetical protein
MQQHKKRKAMEVVVISIANPILIGIYENKILKQTIKKDGKTSDVLPTIFKKLQNDIDITKIIYVNEPGSYMAIKVAYIFLKTFCMVKNIEFCATDGFNFNQNSPIKALGKKYFFKNNGKITIDFLGTNELKEFRLLEDITGLKLTNQTLPKYHLPFV